MTSVDEELKVAVRRNMLLGLWAAEKMGFDGAKAEAYAKDLAVGTLDPQGTDIFTKVRNDFVRAGITQSDEQILDAMESFTLQASAQKPTARANSVDAAEVALKRKLTAR